MFRLAPYALPLAALSVGVSAQADAAGEAARRGPRLGVHRYAESISRDLFSACDADSDDRLDVFEASAALDAVREARDDEGFRRLDPDRDGYVSWPEFDQHFWSVVQRGGTLHVRPCRSLVDQSPERQEARPTSPLQGFLRMHDKNGNGGLEPAELEQMARATNLPPSIASELRGLDLDRSGRVEEAELAPWFELLRGLVPGAGQTEAAPTSQLPPPWQAGDRDGNGRIDAAELTTMLRALDPSLLRWGPQLLHALDRDGDGQLGADELPTTPRPPRHSTAAASPATPTPTVSQAAAAAAAPVLGR